MVPELGIGGNDGLGVAGKIDLRDDLNLATSRVFTNGRQIVNAVTPAVGYPVVDAVAIVANGRRASHRANFSKPGPGGDLHTPALIVVEVKVQAI